MTIQLATLTSRQIGGNFTAGGADSITINWDVYSDSDRDSPEDVRKYFDDSTLLPYLNDPLNLALIGFPDFVRSDYFCDMISPVLDARTAPGVPGNPQRIYRTSQRFTPIYENVRDFTEVPATPPFQPTDNPLQFRRVISLDTAERTIDAPKGAFRGCYQFIDQAAVGAATDLPYGGTPATGAPTRDITDDQGRITNSGNEVYDVPLQKRLADSVFRLRYWTANFAAPWDTMVYKLNSAPYRMQVPYQGFDRTYEADSLLCTQIVPTWRYINNTAVWMVDFEFAYREFDLTKNMFGWLDLILDEGVQPYAGADAPDPNSGSSYVGDPPAGVPINRRVKDRDENVLPAKVLFNGKGQPLNDQSTYSYYLSYRLPFLDTTSAPNGFIDLGIGFEVPP